MRMTAITISNEEDANLSVYDLNSDEIISSIAFPFGDGYLGGISHDGGILLGTYSDDDKSSACLVDAKTGAKSEFDSHWCGPTFMNGDREIWTDYYDEDSSTLHVNIYKSNIPHSLPEDVLYFVQTHLPFVIGGGVAIVLIIGGATLSFATARSARRPRTVRQPQRPSPSASNAVARSVPSRTSFHPQRLRCRRRRQLRPSPPASAVTANPARTRSPVLPNIRTKGRLATKTQ